jgi:hypothetical protein
MTTKIFRDAALESLASPDQLDRALVVVRPRAWLVLVALGVSLLGLASWAFLGTHERTSAGEGLWLRPSTPDSRAVVAVIYTPDAGSALIQPGTPVRIRPASSHGLSKSWIDARVASVGPGLVSRDAMSTRLRDPDFARDLHTRLGTPVQLELVLADPSSLTRGQRGTLKPTELGDGARVECEIVFWQGKPIDLLLGMSTVEPSAQPRRE